MNKKAKRLVARRRHRQKADVLHKTASERINTLPEPLRERVSLGSPAPGVVDVWLAPPGKPWWHRHDGPKLTCRAKDFPNPTLIGQLLVLA